MANRRAMRVTMSARAVVAAGLPFAPYGVVLSDPGVARDEISTLLAGSEPLLLRVVVSGGAASDREKLAGEWLCDSGGVEPFRLPKPSWASSDAARQWSSERTWPEAWETCANAEWMLCAAWRVGVSAATCAAAATAVVGVLRPLLPSTGDEDDQAIDAMERWLVAGAHRSYVTSARFVLLAADILESADAEPSAERTALLALDSALKAVALAAKPDPDPDRQSRSNRAMENHLAYMSIHAQRSISLHTGPAGAASSVNIPDLADAVRRAVPTIEVLRALVESMERLGHDPAGTR